MSLKPIHTEDYINKTVEIKIDRPIGSKHPKHGFIYLLNYGYVPGVPAPDGDDLDAYVLGIFKPITKFKGKCIAIIRRFNDNDDKLIIVQSGRDFSNDQIRSLTEFQERFSTNKIIRRV